MGVLRIVKWLSLRWVIYQMIGLDEMKHFVLFVNFKRFIGFP